MHNKCMGLYGNLASKILRCASYFQLISRCMDIPMKQSLMFGRLLRERVPPLLRDDTYISYRNAPNSSPPPHFHFPGTVEDNWFNLFFSSLQCHSRSTQESCGSKRPVRAGLWADEKKRHAKVRQTVPVLLILCVELQILSYQRLTLRHLFRRPESNSVPLSMYWLVVTANIK